MFAGSTVIAAWLIGAGLGGSQPATAQPFEGQNALTAAVLTYEATLIEAPAAGEPLVPAGACDLGAEASGTDFTPVVACSRCPIEWPSCYNNKSCDSVCGGKGTGVCQWINSCSKCCTCAGTT